MTVNERQEEQINKRLRVKKKSINTRVIYTHKDHKVNEKIINKVDFEKNFHCAKKKCNYKKFKINGLNLKKLKYKKIHLKVHEKIKNDQDLLTIAIANDDISGISKDIMLVYSKYDSEQIEKDLKETKKSSFLSIDDENDLSTKNISNTTNQNKINGQINHDTTISLGNSNINSNIEVEKIEEVAEEKKEKIKKKLKAFYIPHLKEERLKDNTYTYANVKQARKGTNDIISSINMVGNLLIKVAAGNVVLPLLVLIFSIIIVITAFTPITNSMLQVNSSKKYKKAFEERYNLELMAIKIAIQNNYDECTFPDKETVSVTYIDLLCIFAVKNEQKFNKKDFEEIFDILKLFFSVEEKKETITVTDYYEEVDSEGNVQTIEYTYEVDILTGKIIENKLDYVLDELNFDEDNKEFVISMIEYEKMLLEEEEEGHEEEEFYEEEES